MKDSAAAAAIAALFEKPSYDGIARACTAQVELSTEQAAAVLHAYDCGIDELDGSERAELDQVLAQLKAAIWP